MQTLKSLILILCNLVTIYANNAAGSYSYISGGRFNLATGDYTFIGSGYNNSVYGDYSSNLAGLSNIVNGYNSHMIGHYGINNADNSLTISLSPMCINNVEESVNICAKNGIIINGVSLSSELSKINESIQWLSEHHQNTSNYLISEINERHQRHNDSFDIVHSKIDGVLNNTSDSIQNIKIKLDNFVDTYNTQTDRDNKTIKANTAKISQVNETFYNEVIYLKKQLNESYFVGFSYLESQIDKLNNTFISNFNQLVRINNTLESQIDKLNNTFISNFNQLVKINNTLGSQLDKLNNTFISNFNQLVKINNTLEYIKMILSNNSNISIEERIIMVNEEDSTFKTTIILLLSFAMLLFLLILGIVIDTRRKLIKNDKIHAGKQRPSLKSMAAETLPVNDASSNSTIEQGPKFKKRSRQRQRLQRLPRPVVRNKQEVNNDVPILQQGDSINPV